LFVGAVKAAPVIFDDQLKGICLGYVGSHLYVTGAGVTADVAQSLLRDPINLNLRAGGQVQFFIQVVVTDKFMFEPAIGRGVFDGVRQSELQRGRESDVLQRRGAQIFADAPHLLRDRFNLRTQRTRL